MQSRLLFKGELGCRKANRKLQNIVCLVKNDVGNLPTVSSPPLKDSSYDIANLLLLQFQELMEEQDKAVRKQSLAIARCYPMKNREQDIMPCMF